MANYAFPPLSHDAMTLAQTARADAYFQAHTGFSFDQLLAPIAADAPAGGSLRGSPFYAGIRQARAGEDASLPLGSWERELKRPDWSRVTAMAASALAQHSKDLQLAVWLLQAQLQRTGLDALAPGCCLLQQLCARYWETLYPPAPAGDTAARANIFHWLNEKLLRDVRLLPLARDEHGGEFGWADWEQAQRNAALHLHPAEQEGPSIAAVLTALRATPTASHAAMLADLAAGRDGLEALSASLPQHFGDAAPGLGALGALLQKMHVMLAAELQARGVAEK